MRGRVALGMPVFRMVPRVHLVQPHENVMLDVRIGILIDRNTGCRMGTVHDCNALPEMFLLDPFGYLPGNVDHLIPLSGG
jgi:hypothetical protein